MARFAVIGAGITGLAAAWELGLTGHDVVVFEADDRVGGKIDASPVAGLEGELDAAADAFLVRVPDAADLCEELGLDDLVHPDARNAFVCTRDGLHPLPAEQLLGLPTDLDALAATGLVSAAGIEVARADLHRDAPPWREPDVAIGTLVRERLGDEVHEHLVQPLVGGINAGDADALSAAAVAPQHLACARRGGSLVRAAAELKAAASDPSAPVFAAPRDGMAILPRRLAERAAADIRLATPVRSLSLAGPGVVVDGSRFDGVIVTTPADVTARLVRPLAPVAADALATIEFASVVMVTLVYERDEVGHALDGSGFVVARTAGLEVTACSWGSSKWAHWGTTGQGRRVVLRASIGHATDPVDQCARTDDALIAAIRRDLATAMGPLGDPVGARVSRWPRGLAQYRPGHLDLVERVHASARDTGALEIAGASLGGVGVPACIRQGRAAARHLLGR